MSSPINSVSMEEQDGPSILPVDVLPWQNILDKMANPELDAFQRMKIALYELMPAIAEDKEKDLSELAKTFEEVVDIEGLIEETQTIFNDIKDSDGEDMDLGQKYLDNLGKLADAITLAGENQIIDKDLSVQLTEEINGMITDITDNQYEINTTLFIKGMWNSYGSDYSEEEIGQLKTQLDGFNDVGSGISGFSASLQNELQFEIANYQQFLGVQDELYREDMSKMKAHVSKMVPR